MTSSSSGPAVTSTLAAGPAPTRDACLEAAAQQYVDAIAERDSLTARDAAIAAGARTETEITALAARIRDERTPHAKPA